MGEESCLRQADAFPEFALLQCTKPIRRTALAHAMSRTGR
jgi:hypothetical protein